MKKARVPSGPILSMQQISRDPQYRARKMFHAAPLLPLEPREQGKEGEGEEEVPPVIVPAILPVLSRQVSVGDGLWWSGVMRGGRGCILGVMGGVGDSKRLEWLANSHGKMQQREEHGL